MASKERILCIDIGADSIKASEFCLTSENVELDRFAYQEYISDSDDSNDFQNMLTALKEVIVTNQFESRYVYLSLSSQSALIPFIKVPSMSTDPQKIRELVTFEAKSKIPGDFNDIVWDYQVIDNEDNADEIDAMLVSMKNNDVIEISKTIMACGKRIKSIEVSPTAIYNSARANGIGRDQCEMVLNIGGKSSTLVFLDGNRFFIRSIPVAGNTITQQIAKEFNMSYADADDIKRRHGYVAPGGAYEEPESTVAATVSKIVRNVMTRLHGEINRSINVYRATQHGRKPEKLYLCGGSSVMAFTPRFFIEKLHVPVDYFNPFEVIPISENVDKNTLQELAHLYGETIGLALRHFRSTPIEISLIPDFVKKLNTLKLKKPFFVLSAIVLLLYLGVTYFALGGQTEKLQVHRDKIVKKAEQKSKLKSKVMSAKGKLEAKERELQTATDMLAKRNGFISALNIVQDELQKTHRIWLSSLSFTDKPALDRGKGGESADAAEEESSPRRRRAGKKNQGGDDGNSKETAVGTQWINLAGYVYTAPNDGSLALTVLNNVASELDKQDVTSMTDADNKYKPSPKEVYHSTNGDTVLSSFTYSLRLKNSTGN